MPSLLCLAALVVAPAIAEDDLDAPDPELARAVRLGATVNVATGGNAGTYDLESGLAVVPHAELCGGIFCMGLSLAMGGTDFGAGSVTYVAPALRFGYDLAPEGDRGFGFKIPAEVGYLGGIGGDARMAGIYLAIAAELRYWVARRTAIGLRIGYAGVPLAPVAQVPVFQGGVEVAL